MISHEFSWYMIMHPICLQWFYPNSVGFSVSSISWNELHTVPLRQASSAQALAQPHVFETRTMQQKNAKPCVFDPPRWQEVMTRWRKNQHGKGTSCFFQQGWCFEIETVGLSLTTSVTSVCQRVWCKGLIHPHDSPVVVSICGSTWDYHPTSWSQWAHAVLVISIHMLGVDHFDPSIPNRGLRVEIHIKSFYSLLVLSSLFPLNTQLKNIILIHTQLWLNCDTFTASALFQGCKCVAATWPRGK